MKNSFRFMLGIIFGVIIGGISVHAAGSLFALDIVYDNSTSKLTATNVEDAINELNELASNAKISSDAIDFTTVSMNNPKTIMVSSKGICIILNGNLECFKINDYSYERKHMLKAYKNDRCYTAGSGLSCDSTFSCMLYNDGEVYCKDNNSNSSCRVTSSGSKSCD